MMGNNRRNGTADDHIAATVSSLLNLAALKLQASTSARLDAEVLLQHVLGVDRSWIYAHGDNVLGAASCCDFRALVSRRRDGMPVSYLVGAREFWSLPLQVNRYTLIPRPETEALVETCLRVLRGRRRARILDLGTGSGAIALALARERSDLRIAGADISREALDMARSNAHDLNLEDVEFVHSDWFSAFGSRRFDLIVCNPPYVDSDDPALVRDDIRFEPRLALDGGHGGLQALQTVISGAGRHLEYGGRLLLEHGESQGESVRRLLACRGYTEVATIRDAAGHERVSGGRWS